MLKSKLAAIDLSLLILRILSGGLMAINHGWGKLNKIINGNWSFGDPIGLGEELSLVLTVFAEFACAIFLVFGILSRLASIPLVVTMAVAAFIVHGGDGLPKQEMALIYLGMYLVILISGPGKYSLDRQLLKK